MKMFNVLIILLLVSSCAGQTPRAADKDASWKVVVAPKAEPGERLIVAGTVYSADGVTTVEGATVYVYHTDINGYYSGQTTNNSNPRLNGTMRTNAKGQYEFHTIKPGPYPSARVPSHIHYVVGAPGHKERIFEIVFEGDSFITDQMRADSKNNEESMFSVRPAERNADGILMVTQDIKLKRQ
jgi:protocatechuate 3,4-dioxygenase, beta subunit